MASTTGGGAGRSTGGGTSSGTTSGGGKGQGASSPNAGGGSKTPPGGGFSADVAAQARGAGDGLQRNGVQHGVDKSDSITPARRGEIDKSPGNLDGAIKQRLENSKDGAPLKPHGLNDSNKPQVPISQTDAAVKQAATDAAKPSIDGGVKMDR